MLTLDRARELFEYDPSTGALRWKISRSHMKAGAIAGTDNGKGYLFVQVDGVRIVVHRVAWLLHYGELPSLQIDHINRDKKANWIANLRLATNSQNIAYAPKKRTQTGYRGVWLNKATNKYCAHISVGGKMKHLGSFDDPIAAHDAYKAAAIQQYGEFANFG